MDDTTLRIIVLKLPTHIECARLRAGISISPELHALLWEVITAKIGALDKRRCFRLRGGAFMRSVLNRGCPSGPFVVVLSERW